MPSRQMAFQMTEFQYLEHLKQLASIYDLRDPALKIEDWLERAEPDEKKRDRLKAVLLISVRCHKNGIDPMRVKKLVCWRDAEGKPSDLEALVDGNRRI